MQYKVYLVDSGYEYKPKEFSPLVLDVDAVRICRRCRGRFRGDHCSDRTDQLGKIGFSKHQRRSSLASAWYFTETPLTSADWIVGRMNSIWMWPVSADPRVGQSLERARGFTSADQEQGRHTFARITDGRRMRQRPTIENMTFRDRK